MASRSATTNRRFLRAGNKRSGLLRHLGRLERLAQESNSCRVLMVPDHQFPVASTENRFICMPERGHDNAIAMAFEYSQLSFAFHIPDADCLIQSPETNLLPSNE